jgi:phage terminase small subunit
MGLPKRLTNMQIKFANLLVNNIGRKTATECAIEAGYDEDRARITASELQNPEKFPLVAQYIGQIKSEALQKHSISLEKHLVELGELRNKSSDNKAWTAAINAEMARGKAAGFYNQLHVHKNADQLTDEELDEKVKKSLKRYGHIFTIDLNDVTEVKEESPEKDSPPSKNYLSSSSSKSSSSDDESSES